VTIICEWMHHINEELVDECKTMPGYIEVVDNYGGKKNTYVYRKLPVPPQHL